MRCGEGYGTTVAFLIFCEDEVWEGELKRYTEEERKPVYLYTPPNPPRKKGSKPQKRASLKNAAKEHCIPPGPGFGWGPLLRVVEGIFYQGERDPRLRGTRCSFRDYRESGV